MYKTKSQTRVNYMTTNEHYKISQRNKDKTDDMTVISQDNAYRMQ
jgi:hypothetical protein